MALADTVEGQPLCDCHWLVVDPGQLTARASVSDRYKTDFGY